MDPPKFRQEFTELTETRIKNKNDEQKFILRMKNLNERLALIYGCVADFSRFENEIAAIYDSMYSNKLFPHYGTFRICPARFVPQLTSMFPEYKYLS